MRIDRFDLIAYGLFAGKSLDFSEGSEGLHVIYGDNEAGKSTSLRALIAWLFGIPARTGDNYIFSNQKLRIGGKLRLAGGRELEFDRRKGNKDTLLCSGTDQPLDDSILQQFIPSGVDENLYTKLYGINHYRLTAGGQELLNQSGDLGQALFSAAFGTAGLRELINQLQTGAEELYRPRASTRPVNRAIVDYREARKRIKDSSLKVSEWKSMQSDLEQTGEDVSRIEAVINDLSRKKSRFERLNRVKGTLAGRRAQLAEMEELENVLLLPEDFDETARKTIEDLDNARETRKKAEARLKHLDNEEKALETKPELLQNEQIIAALFKELGAVEKVIIDRPLIDGQRHQLLEEAGKILKTIRPDLSVDDIDQLRPLLNNKKRLNALAGEYHLLRQEKEKIEAEFKDLDSEEQALQQELAEIKLKNLDLGLLKATINAARKPGDLEKQLARQKKNLRVKLEECTGELSRLGRYSGSLEQLNMVALPEPETLDRFEKELDFLAEERKEAKRKLKQYAEEEKEAGHGLEALLLKGSVPTQQELDQARDLRNHGWLLIKQNYIENIDKTDQIEVYTAGAALVTVYEQKINTADNLSDQLRHAADEVVKRAHLEATINDRRNRCKELVAECERLEEQEIQVLTQWHAIWEKEGINEGNPREMKQWMVKVKQLVKNYQQVVLDRDESAKLNRELERIKETVISQVEKFDDASVCSKVNLESLIDLCEEALEEEENSINIRNRLKRDLSGLVLRRERLQDKLKANGQKQKIWLEEWSQSITGLGVDPGEHPANVTERFDRLVEFINKYDQSESLRSRIQGMDQVAEEFNKKVLAFAESIGLDTKADEAKIIAARLNGDLNQAREARAGLKKIKDQQKEAKEIIENAAITIDGAASRLEGLRKKAGVDQNEQLQAAAAKSNLKRELQKSLDRYEEELARHGDGLNIDALEEEALQVDIDTVDAELEKLTGELIEKQKERDALRDRLQSLRDQIAARDDSTVAAAASAEAEEKLAAIVSGAEQYLRLQIAALILSTQIESYRRKNQAPVLSRAGELFSTLTLGSFKGLRDELGPDSKPVLLGVRPENEEITVEAMSDGTRDQLYLSLRLATLEQYLQHGETMPFVVDDILIGFDDQRTKVCLEVLAELALNTQVLLFTHHRKVLEIASSLHKKAGIFVHELG